MLSVVIPARDEEAAIESTITTIRQALTDAKIVHEIIVVDDGSTDKTGAIATAASARVVRHPISGGYGRALKDGIAVAQFDLIAITDADGTYPNDRLPDLYALVDSGFDMAIGARTGKEYRGSFFKMPARRAFVWLSEYATGRKIDDINSGLRIFRKEIVTKYVHTISNGFSFTTTITLASMLNGYFVKYIPIPYYKRIGTASHVRYWRDSKRSLQIVFENILYYNPLKLFLLIVNALFGCSLVAAAGAVLLPTSVLTGILSFTAAICFGATFIVGAIGLSADLNRMLAKGQDVSRAEPPRKRD